MPLIHLGIESFAIVVINGDYSNFRNPNCTKIDQKKVKKIESTFGIPKGFLGYQYQSDDADF